MEDYDDEVENTASDPMVEYMPCNFCGSEEYDMFDGDVDDDGKCRPISCDMCGLKSAFPLH